MVMADKDADYYIEKLALEVHPEGGYFREVYRCEEGVVGPNLPSRYGTDRCFSTAIYYLLKDEQFSAFHRLKSDELWHYYAGSPMKIYSIEPSGDSKTITIGPDLDGNELLQAVIKRHCWFAARVKHLNSFSLVGCTVAPGFDFEDFEMGVQASLMREFPQHADLISALTS